MGNIKKEDIAMALAEKYEITKRDSREYVDFVIKSIEKGLLEGQIVDLAGLAKFEAIEKPSHQAKNPATGETVTVPKMKKVKVTVKQALKDVVSKA